MSVTRFEAGCPQFAGIIWEIPKSYNSPEKKNKRIRGTLVLDIDGTLTKPNDPYEIENDAIKVLGDFLEGGGNLVFCTGATLGRIERTVLIPLYQHIKEKVGKDEVQNLFTNVIIMPENGSALLLNKRILIEENELKFDWYKLHELHVPNKKELAKVVREELMKLVPDSAIAGDESDSQGQRDYILSWKKVCPMISQKTEGYRTTREWVEYIREEIIPNHPEIDWSKVAIKAARTTIDFVHADSGKTISVQWLLKEIAGLDGPVIGFGDLGDEFAKVIPTFNVNAQNPNEFRLRGNLPAMDLYGYWQLVEDNKYTITGLPPNQKVRDIETDEEIQVVRAGKGEIVFAIRTSDGILSAASADDGYPIKIMPAKDKDGEEIKGAGKGTAWLIRRLIEVRYFSSFSAK